LKYAFEKRRNETDGNGQLVSLRHLLRAREVSDPIATIPLEYGDIKNKCVDSIIICQLYERDVNDFR